MPFSIHELKENGLLGLQSSHTLFKGGYPRIYAAKIDPVDFYSSYINTYIERDVRQLINVGDLNTFQKFLALCAGRVGQLLNLSELAMSCGISISSATRWLSVLQASYIIFILQPHFNNFNKRINKTPKLFFYDTGVACSLLRIVNEKTLALTPFRGNLFENLIISDFFKQYYNNGMRPSLYFWRDKNGRIEVDCIIDQGTKLVPIEIKASQTIATNFFNGIVRWNELSDTLPADNYIIYAGDTNQKRNKGRIIGWQSAATLIDKLSQ